MHPLAAMLKDIQFSRCGRDGAVHGVARGIYIGVHSVVRVPQWGCGGCKGVSEGVPILDSRGARAACCGWVCATSYII